MFKIKNRFLTGLVQWLQLQSLSGKESRERTRFSVICQERVKEVNGFYSALIEKFVEKDTKGHFKTREQEGVQIYSFKTKKEEEEYIKEVNDLFEEEFKMENTPLNKEMLVVIKNIVLNTDYKFGPKDSETPVQKQASVRTANEYEQWCQAFENITA